MSEIRTTITVGLGSCGIAAGGQDVVNELEKTIEDLGLDVGIQTTGCCGMCHREVILEVLTPDGEKSFYGDIDSKKARRVVEEHLKNDEPIVDWLITPRGKDIEEEDYFRKQKRVVLRNCGRINPESIDDYRQAGGFLAIKKCVEEMTPQGVIDEVKSSGLRGRGGAGFSTGMKWQFAIDAAGEQKYVVCNADEGDPGAFMDRSVLEGDPYSVLEGMLVCAYAIGASRGYIYCRAEYPLAVRRLNMAIESMTEEGLLGDEVLGSDFSFTVKVKEGAGAFFFFL